MLLRRQSLDAKITTGVRETLARTALGESGQYCVVPLATGMDCHFGRLRATRSQITVQWHPAEITASTSVSCERQI